MSDDVGVQRYTYAEAARRLSVSTRWLRQRVADGTVSCVRLEAGRLVRSTDAHLAQVVRAPGERRAVESPAPAEAPAPLATRRRARL